MLGPVLAELLKIASWKDKKRVQAKYKRPPYWICTAVLFIASGIVTVLQGTQHIPISRAVQLGLNAPLIVAAWASGEGIRRARRRGGAQFMPEMPDESKSIANLLSW